MAGRDLEEALDIYVERIRLGLSCIVDATLFGSGVSPDEVHSLTLYARGQPFANRVRLRTHEGRGELFLWVFLKYNLVFQPDVIKRFPFDVWTSHYQYLVLDRNEREIIAFHWHMGG